jgi:hypothetical protein
MVTAASFAGMCFGAVDVDSGRLGRILSPLALHTSCIHSIIVALAVIVFIVNNNSSSYRSTDNGIITATTIAFAFIILDPLFPSL